MKKWTLGCAVLMLCLVMVSGCGGKREDKLAQIQRSGRLILGTSADYPPYEFHTIVNGQDTIAGFDVAVAKQIAFDLGVQLEIRDMRFDGLLAALASGNVDIVLAGMTPDEERKKNADFSNIYYAAVQGVLVRAGEQGKFKTMADFNGMQIGVQKGTVQEKLANEQIPSAKVTALGKVSDLVLELKYSGVDAVIVEQPAASAFLFKNKDLALAPAAPQESVGGSAAAVRNGQTALVQAVDKTIGRLIADKRIDAFVAEAKERVQSVFHNLPAPPRFALCYNGNAKTSKSHKIEVRGNF